MTRFIAFLLGKKYEPCHACEVLSQQLAHERDEKRLLIDTLVNIVKPKTYEAPPVELNQIVQSSALFSRRRAALEEKDRQEAKILAEKRNLGVPDRLRSLEMSDRQVNELERELGIADYDASIKRAEEGI